MYRYIMCERLFIRVVIWDTKITQSSNFKVKCIQYVIGCAYLCGSSLSDRGQGQYISSKK